MEKELKELEKEISRIQKAIEKINKKEKKEGSLSNVDAGTRSTYQKMLNEKLAKKENLLSGGSKTVTPAQPKKVDNTPATTKAPATKAPVVNKPSTSYTSPKEKLLENVEAKADKAADAMNSEEDGAASVC